MLPLSYHCLLDAAGTLNIPRVPLWVPLVSTMLLDVQHSPPRRLQKSAQALTAARQHRLPTAALRLDQFRLDCELVVVTGHTHQRHFAKENDLQLHHLLRRK